MFDVTLIGAFLGGIVIFFSPCVLPIVPFYLSYMAGMGVGAMNADGQISPAVRRRAVSASIFFSLGIISVFVALGAAAFGFSQTFRAYQSEFRWFAAAVVALLGLHFLGMPRIALLDRQFKMEMGDTSNMTGWSSYLVGVAFAAGWTPCVGGVLAAVMFQAANSETAMRGMLLLFVLGIGMTLPFIIAAFFIRPFLKLISGFRQYLGLMEKVMGLFLLGFAVLIAANQTNAIANWLLKIFPNLWI